MLSDCFVLGKPRGQVILSCDILGLEGLYCTGISGECFEYDSDKMTTTKVDGDFRSSDSTRFLEQPDIIVSNPPFSLFREYVALLIDSDKDFLVIGNKNAVSYKRVFTAMQTGRVRHFDTPTGPVNLQGMSRWFTTFSTPDKTFWIPAASMDESKTVKYDLYPANNYDKISYLPKQFDGLAGVPLTAIDKIDPSEFEFVDLIPRYAVIDHAYDTPGHQLTEINGRPHHARDLQPWHLGTAFPLAEERPHHGRCQPWRHLLASL